MSYRSRPITFTYYRFLFVALLFSVGLFCFAHLAIDYFYAYSMITTESQSDHDAVLVGAAVCGLLSTMFGFIVLHLLVDRREKSTDRRQRQVSIDFPDRRSGGDRRAELMG